MITDDVSDSDKGYDDDADLMDANAFQDILCMAIHNQVPFSDAQDATQQFNPIELEDQTDPDDQTDTAGPETASTLVIDNFPFGCPGTPIHGMPQSSSAYETLENTRTEMPWAPFSSHLDWDIAQWAKMYSQTSTAVTELLAIPGVCHSSFLNTMPLIHKIKVVEQLGLSYHTVKELNEMIDDELPGCPPFQCKEVTFNDERLEFYHRDILQCIWVIYGNIQFAPNLVFAPEWHFTSHEHTSHIYNEMHMANWWWKVQVSDLKSIETCY